MQIADSTAIARAPRQSAEQITAAGDAHETKHPAPEAPRLRVEIDQRQGFVETSQGLMYDRAVRLDGSALLSRRHGQHHRLCAPLDVDITDEGRPKRVGGTEFRAPQKDVDGGGLGAR